MNRRQFLQTTAVAAAFLAMQRRVYAFAQSDALAKFIQPLRGNTVGSLITDIGVAAPDGAPAPVTGVTHYTMGIEQFSDQLHPSLGPTKLWGFKPTNYLGGPPPGTRHLGGIVVAQRGTPIQFTFRNNLPPSHIIPVDTTIPGANLAKNRTAVHLHGGLVPWVSDGGPFDWWAPDGTHGESFLNNTILNPGAALNEAEYYYPNNQSARLVWYHDHAIGITRINAYAGIASAYIIRDAFEAGLRSQGLPDFIENGGNEIPIVIQDKIFVSGSTALTDPTWFTLQPSSTLGDLWYAHVYDPKLYKLAGSKNKLPNPSVVPEFFGDTMLANGTVYPEATVEPRRYRLRILNACNARFLNLQLYVDDGSVDSITLNPLTLAPTNTKGPDFLVLGTEGGFLPRPVLVPSNAPFNPVTLGGSLITGPAERWDVIVDFSGYAGQKIVLYNDAPAPFPVGSPLNDYFPGAPLNPTITNPGFGPNSRQIMRFNVGTTITPPADPPLTISPATNLTAGNDPLLAALVPGGIPTVPPGTPVRLLTLNETFDAFGRLIQLEGTSVPPRNVGGGFGRAYTDPATEVVNKNAIEVWQIINLTGDTHPIHFHLVNVQIVSRQPVNVKNYNGGAPTFIGPARPPDPNEAGWKETVRMNPGEVTTVIMQFKLPTVPFTVPSSPRATGTQFPLGLPPGTTGTVNEYVWHCHILEHEEHDMMRPLVVIG
jgi:spore coat protein A